MSSLQFMARNYRQWLQVGLNRRSFNWVQCSSLSERQCSTQRVTTRSSVLLVSSSHTFASSSSKVFMRFSFKSDGPGVLTYSSALSTEKSRERKWQMFYLFWPSICERMESIDFFISSITGAFLLLAKWLLDQRNLAQILKPLGYSVALSRLQMASLATLSMYSEFSQAQVRPKQKSKILRWSYSWCLTCLRWARREKMQFTALLKASLFVIQKSKRRIWRRETTYDETEAYDASIRWVSAISLSCFFQMMRRMAFRIQERTNNHIGLSLSDP